MPAFEVLNKGNLSYLGQPLVGQLSGGWTQFLPLKPLSHLRTQTGLPQYQGSFHQQPV